MITIPFAYFDVHLSYMIISKTLSCTCFVPFSPFFCTYRFDSQNRSRTQNGREHELEYLEYHFWPRLFASPGHIPNKFPSLPRSKLKGEVRVAAATDYHVILRKGNKLWLPNVVTKKNDQRSGRIVQLPNEATAELPLVRALYQNSLTLTTIFSSATAIQLLRLDSSNTILLDCTKTRLPDTCIFHLQHTATHFPIALHSNIALCNKMAPIAMGSTGGEDDIVVVSRPNDENSGQALRTAVTLSAITLRPVRIENIRSLKKNPGMNHPHS